VARIGHEEQGHGPPRGAHLELLALAGERVKGHVEEAGELRRVRLGRFGRPRAA
jgi:hypothetical protein